MPGLTCISDADLRAYLLGELPERVARTVADHLESCRECDAAARRLDGLTDNVINTLRHVFRANGGNSGSATAITGPGEAPAPPPVAVPARYVAGYEVLEEVGRGGMSVVYRARQAHPARVVALKMILIGAHADAERRARFLAEADAIARLQHPHIVQIYEAGQHEGLPFLALEYVAGGSLARRLAGLPQPPRPAAALVEKLAHAVHAVHQRGVIHRDLKPANVLLMEDGTPKITDFGLAKLERPELTATGAVVGTPFYMAPEQAAGRNKAIGPSADLYALGVILYELLTGRPPFLGESALDTLHQVQCHEPVPPRRLQPKVPRDLETICLKCLAKEPDKRYAGAADLAADLRRWQEGLPIHARPAGQAERLVKWARRRPAAATLIVFAALVLVGLTAGAFWARRQQQATRAAYLVQALGTAETPAVEILIQDLADCRPWALPLLRRQVEAEPAGSRPWLHARLALLPDDSDQVDALAAHLLVAQPEEVRVVRDALRPFAARLTGPLWDVLADPQAEGARRLRAASALAVYDPDDPRWPDVRGAVVEQVVRENPFRAGHWAEALRPVRLVLIPPLVAVHRDPERHDTERLLATSVLADHAAGQPELLAELLLEANAEQFALLLPRLAPQPGPALAVLRRHLAEPLAPDGRDEARAKQHANAALALAHLGEPDALWAHLRHTPDPTVRSWLVDRAAPFGLSARLLLERLEREPEVSVRRALLLALGGYDGRPVPAATRATLRERYRDDPDPGTHAALDWLLRRRWREAAAVEQTDAALRGRPPGGRDWFVNSQGQTLVLVRGPVEFRMGSPESEEDRDPDEVLHRVRIGRSFAVAAKEVTVEEYQRSGLPSEYNRKYGPSQDGPMNGLTWYAAAAYCRWLSEQEGVPEEQMCYPPVAEIKEGMKLPANYLERTSYRLPTEAEWEYACRAGATTSRFYGGPEELLGRYAFYNNNSRSHTWPVGTLKPNDLGLFDTFGNVAEWCHDEWLPYPSADQVHADREMALVVPARHIRALRGTTIVEIAPVMRSARRYGLAPENQWASIGLRLARTWR